MITRPPFEDDQASFTERRDHRLLILAQVAARALQFGEEAFPEALVPEEPIRLTECFAIAIYRSGMQAFEHRFAIARVDAPPAVASGHALHMLRELFLTSAFEQQCAQFISRHQNGNSS